MPDDAARSGVPISGKTLSAAAILERHAQKLELLLHPASATGQASIAATRDANDIRKESPCAVFAAASSAPRVRGR
jgi:hypothetical protein